MLPAQFRMRHGDEFGAAISSGARSSTRRVVVHFSTASTRAGSARVGFVVSKAIGGAVQRNRVKRRLRAAMAEELHELPRSARIVVRALPAAAGSTFAELRTDVRQCWRRAEQKDSRRRGVPSHLGQDRQAVR